MKNGIIIDGEKYEYVDGVSDKRDKVQIDTVCVRCALHDKCVNEYGDQAMNYPCDIFDKGIMWHFRRKEEK